jgi:hypothetical protein
VQKLEGLKAGSLGGWEARKPEGWKKGRRLDG